MIFRALPHPAQYGGNADPAEDDEQVADDRRRRKNLVDHASARAAIAEVTATD